MIYHLKTNDADVYVETTEEKLRAAMYRYIRRKREEGMKLSETLYCWYPIRVTRKVPE